MKTNNDYIITFSGLNAGKTAFKYHIDSSFFKNYEYSLVKNCNIDVILTFDKQESALMLEFELKGVIYVECDRCLADMPIPVQTKEHQIIKINDTLAAEAGEDEEVMYISRGVHSLDIAPLLYEFINIQAPLVNSCDGKQEYCDQETLKRVEELNPNLESKEGKSNAWDILKNFSDN